MTTQAPDWKKIIAKDTSDKKTCVKNTQRTLKTQQKKTIMT